MGLLGLLEQEEPSRLNKSGQLLPRHEKYTAQISPLGASNDDFLKFILHWKGFAKLPSQTVRGSLSEVQHWERRRPGLRWELFPGWPWFRKVIKQLPT